MDLPALWHSIDLLFFPVVHDENRRLSLREFLLFVICGFAVFSAIGLLFSSAGFAGYDWQHFFSTGQRGSGIGYYPPWVIYVRHLTWPGLIGVTFTGLALALYQRRASLLATVAAFSSLPLFWTLFLGQIDGVVLFGLTGLPWLVPLATIKPQVALFAILARKQHLLALLIWLVISVAVWGWWPLDMAQIGHFASLGQPHDIHLWPWSLPVVVILLCLSRGDADMLMLAGTFALPYLHSYHYILVTPALARVPKPVAVVAAAISWLPVLAYWCGPWAWFLGHLFPLLLWVSLYQRRRSSRHVGGGRGLIAR